MSQKQDIEYFQRETVRHARTLSFGDAVSYLRGFAAHLPSGDEVSDELREIVLSLRDCEAQLDLFAEGGPKPKKEA